MEVPSDIAEIAKAMNGLRFDEESPYFYELMSGALIWEDEKAGVTFEQLGYMRMIWAFRTGEILESPRSEYQVLWEAVMEAAPDWPGFRADRCNPPEEVIQYLASAKRNSKRDLDRFMKTDSGDWRPLSGGQE